MTIYIYIYIYRVAQKKYSSLISSRKTIGQLSQLSKLHVIQERLTYILLCYDKILRQLQLRYNNNSNNNNNFIYPRYYFTIKIEYLQKKTT